jgi:hypothetical protein
MPLVLKKLVQSTQNFMPAYVKTESEEWADNKARVPGETPNDVPGLKNLVPTQNVAPVHVEAEAEECLHIEHRDAGEIERLSGTDSKRRLSRDLTGFGMNV